MASKQQMNLNQHLRSRAKQPQETKSRMKRNRKRNYVKELQNGRS